MTDDSRRDDLVHAASPVTPDTDEGASTAPKHGVALCLSGGGYRAMLFHVGVLWRLRHAAILPRLRRISSVSGGSITAGILGLRWSALDEAGWSDEVFEELVAMPIRVIARETIDAHSILGGVFGPGSVGGKVAKAYRKHAFGDATLQDLPDEPRFVINATNVQSGVLWRFSKRYMGDWRVGRVDKPTTQLADAVAASSAFPPFLSPVELEVPRGTMQRDGGNDLHFEPFTSRVVLTDGGVYDNLGLETAWKRYDTILVSDAGGAFEAEPDPKGDWAQHSFRILNIVDRQVRALRKRQVIDSFKLGSRRGAYWGIRTDIADYNLEDPLPCLRSRTLELAAVPTRLARMDEVLQERLINWGYAVSDAALRSHVDSELPRPTGFPYPAAGV